VDVQADVVAVNWREAQVFIGEAKWGEGAVNLAVLNPYVSDRNASRRRCPTKNLGALNWLYVHDAALHRRLSQLRKRMAQFWLRSIRWCPTWHPHRLVQFVKDCLILGNWVISSNTLA
jgi:hypothetical protein